MVNPNEPNLKEKRLEKLIPNAFLLIFFYG
jgi:hypothetical protein